MRDVRLSVVTPPAVEPLTLAEVWTDLRLDPSGSPPQTFFDTELNAFIQSAREYVEKATRRALVTQTCALTFAQFPGGGGVRFGGRVYEYPYDFQGYRVRDGGIELPRPPAQSVVSIDYFDSAGTSQTLDPSNYRLVNQGTMPAVVQLVSGLDWPEVACRDDAITITYIAGYPGSVSPPDMRAGVPASLKSAMKLHVRKLFNPMMPEDIDRLDTAVADLIGGYRVERF